MRPVGGQIPAERAIQHSNADRAVDHEAAIRFAMNVLMKRAGRAGEVADDFFENVFERHQASDVAILIDDERDAPAVTLKVQQLHAERRAFGNEIAFALARQLQQPLSRQVGACQRVRDLLHVQDADDVVEIVLAHRQARVRRRAQRVEDRVPIVADVDAGDLAARDHDVIDLDVVEVEQLVRDAAARIVRRPLRLFFTSSRPSRWARRFPAEPETQQPGDDCGEQHQQDDPATHDSRGL